jgi:hypothetical protein
MKLFILILLAAAVLKAEIKQKDAYEETINTGVNPKATGYALFHIVDFLIQKEKQEKTTISGFCQIKNSTSAALNMPCHNVAVVLTNPTGKEKYKVFATEGKFAFKGVLDDQEYFLVVNSKKFKISEKKIGPLKGGDQIMLNVIYKENDRK